MGLTSHLLRLPRPKTFLYTMSLSTGASLITLLLLLNKVSGLYGLLALLTGFELNTLQFSMYIYSLFALVITAYLAPHIRDRSPFHSLALAWFYLVDSIINAAYTATFALTWFLVLAQHHAGQSPGEAPAPGAGTIDDTSGFTSPEHFVDSVDVVDADHEKYGDAVGGTVVKTAAASPAGVDPSSAAAAAAVGGSGVAHGVLLPESMNSLGVVIVLWTIRLYFCVVMLSYARMVLRSHIAYSAVIKSNGAVDYTSASKDASIADNPFSATRPEGHGWKGRLGRLMVSFPKWYWLGAIPGDDEDVMPGYGYAQDVGWMQGMSGRLRGDAIGAAAGSSGRGGGSGTVAGAVPGATKGTGSGNAVESGPTERERRRRSGTGPPPPSIQVVKPSGQKSLAVPLQDLS